MYVPSVIIDVESMTSYEMTTIHGFSYTRSNAADVYELQVASTEQREYILMRVYGQEIDFKRISF